MDLVWSIPCTAQRSFTSAQTLPHTIGDALMGASYAGYMLLVIPIVRLN